MRGSALSNRWRRSNQSLRRRISWLSSSGLSSEASSSGQPRLSMSPAATTIRVNSGNGVLNVWVDGGELGQDKIEHPQHHQQRQREHDQRVAQRFFNFAGEPLLLLLLIRQLQAADIELARQFAGANHRQI